VTLLPTVLIALPTGAGDARLGAPWARTTRAGSTIRSSQRIWARPEKEPCPISEAPITSRMLSSLPTTSHELTADEEAARAALPNGRARPMVRPEAAPRNCRRSMASACVMVLPPQSVETACLMR
jgi:hypothetical protein